MKPKSTLLTAGLFLAATTLGLAQPIITNQPQSRTNIAGTTATFSVAATGSQPLAYQWRFNGADFVDETNTSLALTNVQAVNAGDYTVIVSNAEGVVTSAVATLTVLVPPKITGVRLSAKPATPQDGSHTYATFSVSPGADLNLTAVVSGTTPLSYQWQFSHVDMPGQTSNTLPLPNVQLTNGGDYTLVASNAAGSTNRTVTLSVDPTFTKITTGPVVTDPGFSQGGTWADYNNDGLLDLLVFNGQGSFVPFLYRNNGDGTFTKITSGPPVELPAEAYSACWGDYDNDGNADLYVTASGGQALLYHNSGNGIFTRITTGRIVTDVANALGAAWADYDSDGFLDLLVTLFDSGASPSSHCFLYRNNGDGTFASITNNGLVSRGVSSVGCAWADYDNDGYPDVFVTGGRGTDNPLAPNRLYHNNGDGTFTRVTAGSIVTDEGYSGPCAWGDYDNDGFLDLFVGNIGGVKNFLYHNNGDGTFTRITNGIVANDLGTAWPQGCAWGDYDNDGFLDLFVTYVPSSSEFVVNSLYHNNGDGTFTKITSGSPVNEYSDSTGCAWADYDNDGFLDLFAARTDRRGSFLYRNNGNSNSWLTVELVGTASNRSAIGAKVRVKATIAGVSRSQLRQITGGSGFAGHNELRANFGLGDATNIDTVRIEWPSGIVQELTNVTPRQILSVTEHQAGLHQPPRFTGVSRESGGTVNLTAAAETGSLCLFEGSTNLVNWTWLGVRSNATGTVQFTDLHAANYSSHFYRVSVP